MHGGVTHIRIKWRHLSTASVLLSCSLSSIGCHHCYCSWYLPQVLYCACVCYMWLASTTRLTLHRQALDVSSIIVGIHTQHGLQGGICMDCIPDLQSPKADNPHVNFQYTEPAALSITVLNALLQEIACLLTVASNYQCLSLSVWCTTSMYQSVWHLQSTTWQMCVRELFCVSSTHHTATVNKTTHWTHICNVTSCTLQTDW